MTAVRSVIFMSPTIEIVEGCAVPRDGERMGHAKHMLRLRRDDGIGTPEAAEVISVNSHDETSPYQMFAGVLRFICTNSMIAGERFEEVRVPHRAGIPDQIIEGVYPSNADHTNSGAHHQTASDSNLLTADCRRFHAFSSQAIFRASFVRQSAVFGVLKLSRF